MKEGQETIDTLKSKLTRFETALNEDRQRRREAEADSKRRSEELQRLKALVLDQNKKLGGSSDSEALATARTEIVTN